MQHSFRNDNLTSQFAKLIVLLFCVIPQLSGQASTMNEPTKNINVYLNCSYCYEDFLKTEITFVNFVQDQFVADVNLLITTLTTGSSGEQFNLIFIGQKAFKGMNDTLSFTANGINSEVEKRNGLANIIKLGMVRYLVKSGNHSMLQVASINPSDSAERGIGANPSDDPWNAWVFNLRSNMEGDGQRVTKSFSINNSFSANRTTDKSKFDFRASSSYRMNKFTFDDETYKFEQRDQSVNALYVHSINSHWSAGLFGSARRSIFSNFDLMSDAYFAVEYNIFPYNQAQTKAVTFSYFLGSSYFDFTDTTIYNKTEAIYATHNFSINTTFNKEWGSISGAIYANQFVSDLKKYRYGGFLNLDVRIFRGLSLSSYFSYDAIADQINIKKQGASSEEILLQQQELSTNFSFYAYLGINYRFGSIYNNVVNPRFNSR